MSRFDLPEDRLATTDEKGSRVYLYPADVRGFFKKYRTVVHFLLMITFLGLPWLRINGHQALLLNIADRKFAVFGLTFWGHDAPMLFFVLAAFFLSIGLVTAILGRIWCGWACPETVFVDFVYRRIERWIEGDAPRRRQLDQSSMSPKKFFLKGSKWTAFLIVSLLFTHSFLAYFIGTEALMEMVRSNPFHHLVEFKVMLFITALLLFAFGWFREQFCIIMCPYGRFQSTLMDSHSLTVAYDSNRGEPRKSKSIPKDQQGDCINCYRCVQVCPTGVDIRRGTQQLECIACTACIDACDEVMEKVNKPKGLIRYETDRGLEGKRPRHIRPRTFIYSGALFAILAGLIYVLTHRSPVTSEFFLARNIPYQVIQESRGEKITNQFVVNISNYTFEDSIVKIESLDSDVEIISPLFPYSLEAGSQEHVSFFMKFSPSQIRKGKGKVALKISSDFQGNRDLYSEIKEVSLIGPF